MDRRTLLTAGAACLLGPPAFAQDADPLHARLESLRASAGIPALGGAIVTTDGLLWSGVTGLRRQGGTELVAPTDRWHLGSNTKAMTAALYARLVDQGRASWGALLPGLFPDILVDPAWSDVTVEHLMGHRSGLDDAEAMTVWMIAASMGGRVTGGRTALAEHVLQRPPVGAVGAFSYSNAGYILLGAAIERITGEPWEDTMRREVFDPLGMTSAGFGAPLGENAWGHRGASLVPADPAVRGSDNPTALGPAGTAHATLEDYARFLRVFLTPDAGWLSSASLTHLITPFPGPAEGPAYALGWGVGRGRPWAAGRPLLMHDGSNTLWLARAIVVPARGAAAICVANAAEPARPAIDGLTRALIERLPAG